MASDPIAIIGAGQAGSALAERLRHQGYDGPLTLYGAESDPPYQRPPLSKSYLTGEWDRERLAIRSDAHWRDIGVELVLSASVTAISPVHRHLTVNGETRPWSKLALTTGARPKPLPEGARTLGGILSLRSRADTDRLKQAMSHARTLIVLGGGYIGLEIAAVAAKTGLAVTVIEQAPRILQRVACAETADRIRALHKQNGVQILEGRSVTDFIGPDHFRGVRLDQGETLSADLMVVGIGVDPATDLAAQAGLDCANGICVDAYGRTSAPDIWAAGDCTNFIYDGMPTRLESVPHAIEQADCAADDMMGKSRTYQPVPWFWSHQYDLKLQIAGLNRGYDSVVPLETERGPSFWYFKAGRMICVDALNDARTFMAAKKILEKNLVLTCDEVRASAFDPVKWLQSHVQK